MTDHLDPILHPLVRLALAAVLRNPDQHFERYLSFAPSKRSFDHAEAGDVGVALVPEVVAFVEWAWIVAQRLAEEHHDIVNVIEGALGNALYAGVTKLSCKGEGMPPPPATGALKGKEVEAVTRKITRPLADMAVRRRGGAP